jgi:hypothetical protein
VTQSTEVSPIWYYVKFTKDFVQLTNAGNDNVND